jgi:ribose transport system permease protein
VIALTGVVTSIALRDGASPIIAVLEGVLAGGLAGVINGLFITRLKVIPFIATLGTLGMARGVAKWIAGQQTVNVPQTFAAADPAFWAPKAVVAKRPAAKKPPVKAETGQ